MSNLVLNEEGFLSKEMLECFNKNGVTDDLKPYYDNITHYGYNKDWNIVGGKLVQIQFSNNQDVINWLVRLSIKLFHPTIMVESHTQTDYVQLRIASAMIDKLNVSYQDKYMLFDNMQFTYALRKKAYLDFYFKYIEQLPF